MMTCICIASQVWTDSCTAGDQSEAEEVEAVRLFGVDGRYILCVVDALTLCPSVTSSLLEFLERRPSLETMESQTRIAQRCRVAVILAMAELAEILA